MPPPFFCCMHSPSALSYMPSLITASVSFPSSTAILRDNEGSRRFVLMPGSTSLIIIYTHPTLQGVHCSNERWGWQLWHPSPRVSCRQGCMPRAQVPVSSPWEFTLSAASDDSRYRVWTRHISSWQPRPCRGRSPNQSTYTAFSTAHPTFACENKKTRRARVEDTLVLF